MAHTRRDSFNLGAPLVARKPFRFNGKDFLVGDSFPWRRMAVAERKVVNMISSGHIMPAQEEEEVVAAEVVAPAAPKKKAAPKKAAPKKA